MTWGPIQLLIILAIIVVLFGTKKLRNVGKDLGGAIKGFKDASKNSKEDDKKLGDDAANSANNDNVIDAEVVKKENDKV